MKLKPIPPEKFIKVLLKLGYIEKRQKGSHRIFEKKDKLIVIPFHKGRDLGKGLLGKLIKKLDIEREKFYKMVKSILF